MKIFSLLLLSLALAQAQPPSHLIYVNSDPAGSCANAAAVQRTISTGHLWSCLSGTWTDITGSGGGGTGTVTSVSSGNFSPLFNVAVATPTATPVFSFTALTFTAHKFYGNNTGSTATPSAQQPACGDLSDSVSTCNSLASPAFTGNPTAPTQSSTDNSTRLASTAYVTTGITNAIAAVNPAIAVQAATATILPNTPTFTSVASGIGSFFTSSTNSVLVVDGYTPVLNDRILVKNQVLTQNNGVYKVTQLGVASVVPWIMTRALDFDQPSDINNTGAIPVINGTANAATQWVVSSAVTAVDTDPITFTQFSLNPSNIVTAISPGVGLCHFAGSTQACTSSAVVEADQTLVDNTTNNVSTSKHGYVPKAPNDATKFLDGTGAFSVPTKSNFVAPLVTRYPVSGDYTWTNQGGASVVGGSSNPMLMVIPLSASDNLRIQEITVPSTPYTISTCTDSTFTVSNFAWSFPLIVRDVGTGTLVSMSVAANGGYTLEITKWTNITTFSGITSLVGPIATTLPKCYRLNDDGTNFTWSVSWDNDNYTQLSTGTYSSYGITTPGKIGWGGNSRNSQPVYIALFSWKQT